MLTRYATITCFALLLIVPNRLWGLEGVSEGYGNEPLRGFEAWPGIDKVINDETRVYNLRMSKSNDHFMFRGNMKQLNVALENFASIEAEVREVVFRPGPGTGRSLDRTNRIPHNWNLEIPGRTAEMLNRVDQGDLVWSIFPVMTIYIGGPIQLDEIEISEGIVFTELGDLNRRYRTAIATSTHDGIRYSGVERLAGLSPYNGDNLSVVAKMLGDEQYWMRRTAARAISNFGAKAKPHLPALRRGMESDQPALRKYSAESIETIEKAKDTPKAEEEFRAVQEAIQRLCKMRPKRKTDAD